MIRALRAWLATPKSSPVRTDYYTVPLKDIGWNPFSHGRTRWYHYDGPVI